ncbi:UPF0016 domain-containing protein [Parvibium lacunae]|uniref:GDT1 family protein n=1 Tax=Parvibium lacunae TaxID=1888893 RepID=A0A368L3Z1_9BURK|nr:UPF0016 domain-containing protein [Parvibium lacunae]
MIEALLSSTTLVAISEMGDKTQLLALVLAARFRQPWPIIAGIFVATIFNHAAAGWVGNVLAGWLDPAWLQWGLATSLLLMAGWMLIPDKVDEAALPQAGKHGVFWTTTVAFFIAELGDKTQIATVLLAAKYAAWETWGLVAVVMGTTLGMLLANVPVVLIGQKAAKKLPLRLIHGLAAGLFLILAILTLLAPRSHFQLAPPSHAATPAVLQQGAMAQASVSACQLERQLYV